MSSVVLVAFAVVIIGYLFSQFYKTLKELVRLNRICNKEFKKLNGPPALPLIGSAHLFEWDNQKFTYQIEGWGRSYGVAPDSCGAIKLWIGPVPLAILLSPEALRPLLESTENITKPEQYNKITEWIGSGLLTSTNEKWRSRRKILTPTFHFTVLQKYQEVFARQGMLMVSLIARASATPEGIDIFPYIKRCALDIICETAMGTTVNAQICSNNAYVDAVQRISEIIWNHERLPWLWLKPIFYLSGLGFEFDRKVKLTNDFTRKVIADKKKEIEDHGDPETFGVDPDTGAPKKMAFLDMLLKMQTQNTLSDEDIREEVDTFMFEGHDTTASGMVFTLWWLGQYPEYQAKVHEELDEIFGDDYLRPPSNDDVKRMVYLEKCIKEALRLFPSVPFIARRLSQDMFIPHATQGSVRLPAGMTVVGVPLAAGRDARYFERPEDFFPEHFDAERVAKREPYAYVPFSAGPRNCIGQKFAILEEKTVLSCIFRWFQVESVEKWPKGRPVPELILRPAGKVVVKMRRRQKL
ncbi:unnamed protein product [Caenorhabditis auriculariae]|uniref:Uncharacterized protein n=1 Tax=Caenorhabditis auriculariae TaxID=2777116 RepID=A0A8S1HJL1_9PELO|nr:unnamed protein product [Caenorhabditis auriculariae]